MRWQDMTPEQNLTRRAELARAAAQRARANGDTHTAAAQEEIARRAEQR